MIRLQHSIRNKVRVGYYACLALIIVISILNYFYLKRIDYKISVSFIISDLFDTTLEMRRYEKNYFLYGDMNSYEETVHYTGKAENIIRSNWDTIQRLSMKTDIDALESDIHAYQALMERHFHTERTHDIAQSRALEGEIREKGKRIVTAAESISAAERKYIQALIGFSKRVILVSILLSIIVVWLIGRFLSLMVVRPLKQLENSMKSIADGKFDACDTLFLDLSDREMVSLGKACSKMIRELELKQMKVIVQSEKLASLGTMVSGVAHQLNNPLSNISTSCQILREEIEDSDVEYKKELLHQIEGEVERAKVMVRSLLEFSRKKDFSRKPLPLKNLVEDTVRLIQGDIPTHVEVSISVDDDLWIVVDKQRIEQALLNIVKNAIDAITDEGKVSICAKENVRNRTVDLRIQDTGVGIEPENIEKVFNPFFTTKSDGKGSGLGLFVAREIIQEHGGVIDMDSTVGEGTTFLIKLPLKEFVRYEP